jgi:hypothetical protein
MSETTKFQANFKLADGTLVNVYADNSAEFEAQLTTLQDTAALIHSVSQSLGSAGPAKTFQRNFTPRPQATAGAATPAPVVEEGKAPTCNHGPMTYKTGTNAKGPWKGWLCAAPKGATDKCAPIWS